MGGATVEIIVIATVILGIMRVMACILCAKHCAKFFVIMISFNISNNPTELVLFIALQKGCSVWLQTPPRVSNF